MIAAVGVALRKIKNAAVAMFSTAGSKTAINYVALLLIVWTFLLQNSHSVAMLLCVVCILLCAALYPLKSPVVILSNIAHDRFVYSTAMYWPSLNTRHFKYVALVTHSMVLCCSPLNVPHRW